MKNIIKTDDYLLIVSDEEIKVGDWFYGIADGSIKPFIKIADENTVEIVNWQLNKNGKSPNKKITGHLPLNNSPIFEGVLFLPPIEDEVDELADELTSHLTFPEERRVGIVLGYNKAKEKYKYTEDDMIEYSNWLFKWCEYNKYRKLIYGVEPYGIGEFISDKDMFVKFLKEKSHQQPKYPIGFEIENENKIAIDGHTVIGSEPKTTTNSQGQTVLEGKYIYE
jgi:hypothetical protein